MNILTKLLCIFICLFTNQSLAYFNSSSPVGTNTNEVLEYDASVPFLNLFKASLPFQEAAPYLTKGQIKYDLHGWPTYIPPGGMAGTRLLSKLHKDAIPRGYYIVLYEGEGKLEYGIDAKLVESQPGRDVILLDPGSDKEYSVKLTITSTNTNNHLRNISVIPQGGICASNPFLRVTSPTQCNRKDYLDFELHYKKIIFNPDYLKFMRDYKVVRFMNMSGITRNPIRHWKDRPLIENATWGGKEGVRGAPIEIMVELANRLHADPWFTIPHNADNDFVQRFAQYVNKYLDRDLKIYLEYSNETWNGIFTQHTHMKQNAKRIGIPGMPHIAGWRYYAKRSVEIFKIWEQTFGSKNRLVRVLAGLTGATEMTETMLTYEDAYEHVDAFAIAPYVFGDYMALRRSRSIEQVFQIMQDKRYRHSLPRVLEAVRKQSVMTRKYGVDLIAYEGGQHLIDDKTKKEMQHPNPLFYKANRHPQMGVIYKRLLNGWKQAGGKMFVHFSSPRKYNRFGSKGIKEYITQPDHSAPKQLAVQSFIKSNPCWWQGCRGSTVARAKKPRLFTTNQLAHLDTSTLPIQFTPPKESILPKPEYLWSPLQPSPPTILNKNNRAFTSNTFRKTRKHEALPRLLGQESLHIHKKIHIDNYSNYRNIIIDGENIIFSTFDNTIRMWNFFNDRLEEKTQSSEADIKKIIIEKNNNTLAYLDSENKITLWNINKNKKIKTRKFSKKTTEIFYTKEKIISISSTNEINLWNGKLEILKTLSLNKNEKIIEAKPYNGFLYIIQESKVIIIDIEKMQLTKSLKTKTNNYKSIHLIKNKIILIDIKNNIEVWNKTLSKEIKTIKFDGEIIKSEINEKNNYMAILNKKGIIFLSIDSSSVIDKIDYKTSMETEIKITTDGEKIIIYDNKILVYSLINKSLLNQYRGQTSEILSLDKKNQHVATISSDNILRVWSLKDKKLIRSTVVHESNACCLTYNHKNDRIASASKSGKITILDEESLDIIKEINTNSSEVNSIEYSPDGRFLVSTDDRVIKIWDTKDHSLLKTLEGHSDTITSLEFSPNSATLVSGSRDSTAIIWHLNDFATYVDSVENQSNIGQIIARLDDHQSSVSSITFSNKGNTLITSSDDSTIILWDIKSIDSEKKSTEPVLTIENPHEGVITAIEVDENENLLLSTGTDNKLIIYNLEKREIEKSFDLGKFNSHLISMNYKTSSFLVATNSSRIKVSNNDYSKGLSYFLGGQDGGWLHYDSKGNFSRGDPGNFLLSKDKSGHYQPILPSPLVDSFIYSIKAKITDRTPISLHENQDKFITIDISNSSQKTIYWIKFENTKYFHISDNQEIYKLDPNESKTISLKIRTTPTTNKEKPTELSLPIRYNINSKYLLKIPVKVKTPELKIISAILRKNIESPKNNTIELEIKNTGTSKTDKVAIETKVGNTSLIQTSKPISIEPEQTLTHIFSIPKKVKISKKNTLNIDISNNAFPLQSWNFKREKLGIKRSVFFSIALLLSCLATGAIIALYLLKSHHPLAKKISKNPKSIIKFPLEDLIEIKYRLQKAQQLEDTLRKASISTLNLQNAIDFQRWRGKHKASHILKILSRFKKQKLLFLGNPRSQQKSFLLEVSDDFPLNIDKLLLCFPETEAPEDLLQHLRTSPHTQNHITLIIGPDSEYQRRLYITTKESDNKWVAPQSNELTRLLLSPIPENALAEVLAGQLSLQQVSPYRVGGGVSNESTFFGRRELIAQITNRDPANYLMVGGRQVGKSTLLKALERRYVDNPQVQCHYLTLSNEVLIPRLATLLKLEKTSDPENLANQLDTQIQQHGQRYIFLIDEADRFIEHEKVQDYPILNVFRRLSEEGNCTFILAGFWQLYQHVVFDYQSPIRNFGELLSVGALEKPACIELATEPMQNMNLHWDNATLVEELVTSCGQRANLIAIACQHIVRNLPPQRRSITAGDMHNALYSDEMRRALSGWVVGENEEEQTYERMLVYATIERDSFTAEELFKLAQQHNFTLDTQQLERTLSRLELSFVLGRQPGGKWFYRVPLFVDYIREDAPAMKLENELQRLR